VYTHHTKPTAQQVERKRAAYKRQQVLLRVETRERMNEKPEQHTDPRDMTYQFTKF
jgi:hypothetical protein